MGATKYKASFLMVKMEDMGDTHLRARLHTSRVQEWAGNLYPDDGEASPFVSLALMEIAVTHHRKA